MPTYNGGSAQNRLGFLRDLCYRYDETRLDLLGKRKFRNGVKTGVNKKVEKKKIRRLSPGRQTAERISVFKTVQTGSKYTSDSTYRTLPNIMEITK